MVKNNVLAQGHAHLNNPMRNSQYLTSIVQYRQLEIAVFYGQFISIILYVLQCKLFMILKRRYTAYIDSQDPFWMLLSDNQDDFLANDNVIFVCSTLKMTSFLVTWFGFIQLYSNLKDFTIDFPLNILVAILWWILIWQGTRFEIMFSR